MLIFFNFRYSTVPNEIHKAAYANVIHSFIAQFSWDPWQFDMLTYMVWKNLQLTVNNVNMKIFFERIAKVS